MSRARLVACGLAALAMCAPAFAQGKGKGPSGPNDSKKNPPPSRSDLPAAASGVTQSSSGVTPFAWIDDATLIEPGNVSLAVSVARWQGASSSEVDAPIVDAAVGVTPRVHFTATVPHVVGGSDALGAAGGAGTSYLGAKIALLDPAKHQVKVSAMPTIEILGRGVVEALGTSESRVHFGLPLSAEVDHGPARLYVGSGYFSRGIWFVGGGCGVRVNGTAFVSAVWNRSWRTADALTVPIADRARNELTGSVSYALTPAIAVFGSVGRTIATLDENGAGTTVAAGVALSVSPRR
jgi:hypothetical protein